MIEVFKTSVQHSEQALSIMFEIRAYFSNVRVNFDLEDCDNILRVEGGNIQKNKIINILVSEGYFCEALI
jgi:hypothetical protein